MQNTGNCYNPDQGDFRVSSGQNAGDEESLAQTQCKIRTGGVKLSKLLCTEENNEMIYKINHVAD